MAYNFFLMLGVMGDPGTCVAYNKPGVISNGSSMPTAGSDQERKKLQESIPVESNINLNNALKKQADGLSENVASVLKNQAIISLPDKRAGSDVVSKSNISNKAEEEIKLVQDALIKLGKLKPNECEYGKYDEATASAVRGYQQEKNSKDKGFLVDGVVGFQTMKALLEDAAKVPDVKKELGENYNSLMTNINTAWENGGRDADDKLRRIGTNTQRDPGNPGQAEQPRGPGPWAPDGPQELAKQFLSFEEFSQEEKIKWIQKGLNIYVQQRNSRWFVVGGYNLSSLIEDGHKSPQTDRILGDFLHNHPGNGLSVNSDLESLARHLNSNIVDPMVKDIETKDLVITKGAKL